MSSMPIMVRDKKFYKWLVSLIIPIALQSLISFAVSLGDNLMVGRLGETAISGVYMANQIQTILQMLVMGIGAAVVVLGTQYWGKRDRESVADIVGIALKGSAIVGILFTVVVFTFPRQILSLFTNEAAVIEAGAVYIRIISFTYLPFCISNVLFSAMRCVENVRIATILTFITFVSNLFLNWCLIFGNLGFPALGVEGAAIATLTVRILECLLIALYVRFKDDKLLFRMKNLRGVNRILLKDLVHYGLPIVAGDIVWGLNLAVQGGIVGRLGEAATSSVSISNVVFSMVSVVIYGAASASAVIIGQTVGTGNYDLVKQYSRTLQVIYLILGFTAGIVLFVVKDYILLLYNLEPETIVMAKQFMTVLSVTIVGTAYQMSCLTGIVRAGGATHFVLVNDSIFVWGVVIPSALLAAFVFNMEPWVVFACLKCDQILKCIVAVIKVNRFNWMKKLTRSEQGTEEIEA